MERPISRLRQRTTSFNPEAAAFSPEFSFPPTLHTGIHSTTAAGVSHPAFTKAPMFNCKSCLFTSNSNSSDIRELDSPFNDSRRRSSHYRRDPLAPAPVCIEDFLSPNVQTLVRKLEEHPAVREIRGPQPPDSEPAQITEAVAESIPFPSFANPQEQPQARYTTLDINELSVGLGLPAVRGDTIDEVSPAASYKSQTSQAHLGALYGKLIGWALDKPLTAKGLADLLQHQDANTPLEARIPIPGFATGAFPQQIMNISPAQPRAGSNFKTDIFNRRHGSVPMPAETASPPKGASAYSHQHRRSSASSASYRQHARVSSNRQFSRRASRVKRMDQGPMPSAADIYPDDAHWTPSAPIYEPRDYVSYHQEPVYQPQMVVGNPFNWPLPAQAHKPEPAPTAADIDAADIDILALMNELPVPSLDTLARLGNSQDLRISTAFTLPCDERPLTPAQKDGSRYGMRFYGLACGDQWEPPKFGTFEESCTFRIRPRDHDGWGGREWAMGKA
ncbi:hypothetical protein SVAN01_06820 [Stagonosporopsis vannaccii]|nr:hypothetical protein SVAN01_06820 [Stagonosporopsis vannaccii]